MSRVLRVATLVAFGLGGWSVGAVAAAGSAAACEINPGPGSCPPDALTVGTTATQVATAHSTVTADEGNGNFLTATYTENVYRDPTNKYCANCLVWIVQVTNDNSGANNEPKSTDIIEHVTVSNFSGAFVDIGYSTNGAPGMTDSGSQLPTQVDRSSNGSVITWDFVGTANEIQPGQTTRLLEVITNDTAFHSGTVGVIDGVGLAAPGYAPQVPEAIWVPAFTLLGGMMVGGVALRRRHSRAKDEASQKPS